MVGWDEASGVRDGLGLVGWDECWGGMMLEEVGSGLMLWGMLLVGWSEAG